ncbi:MAG: hypothetical protein H0Z30_04850 [Candidatus Marinimicrobia bacterium]|nr:hypothetical protein [Candidatus Neomarinimicrobiota bacterium]
MSVDRIGKYHIALLIAVLIATNILYSPTECYSYEKKSISFVPVLLKSDENIQLSWKREKIILHELKKAIQMKRFFINDLPDTSVRKFVEEMENFRTMRIDMMRKYIEKFLLPEIYKILDASKEIRAKEFVSETDKNFFIVLKAKELGITSDELIKVMNSSYIAVPFISEFVKTKKKDKIQYKISGGIVWYHIKFYPDKKIEYACKIESWGIGSAEKKGKYTILNRKYNADEFAFMTAVNSLALNLQVKTRELKFFKLEAPIISINKRTIYLTLYKEDGLKEDHPFKIGEWIEDKDGNLEFRYSGFVRINKVSSKKENLSTGLAIYKGDWARSMIAVEHPYLGIDIAFKPRIAPIIVKKGAVLTDKFLLLFGNSLGQATAIDLNLNLSISPYIHSFQTFLVGGAGVGIVPVKTKLYSDIPSIIFNWPKESIFATMVNGHIGFLKRYYFGPFAIHLEGLAAFQRLFITDEYKDTTVYIYNNSFGTRLNLGLEYALGIDTNIGFFVGYDLFPPMDWWTIKCGRKEEDLKNYLSYQYPRIYSNGLSFGIYLHFSVSELPFNPFAILQSSLNEN